MNGNHKGLGNYQNPLYPRVLPDSGNNGVRLPGPLISPLKDPECGGPPRTPEQQAADINCILRMMESDRYLMSTVLDLLTPAFPPKNSIPLNPTPSDAVVVTTAGYGGSWTTLQTINTDSGYEGFITGVQLETIPYTAWSEMQFRVRINNAPTPKMDNNSFLPQQMNGYIPLQIYMAPGVSVSLQAINTGASILLGQGQLKGWTVPVRRM